MTKSLPVQDNIGLCMIVRNESAVIERCLRSVLPFISHWTVVDTGSMDDTVAKVWEILGSVPSGHLIQREWINFGHNRTEALELNRSYCRYHLVIDADDYLEGTIPEDLDQDCYSLDVHYGDTRYQRPHIFTTFKPWRYVGPVHEYLECAEPWTRGVLPDLVYHIGGGGARSQDPDKYLKDAKLLGQALEEEPWHPRWTFYLAQSYRDAGHWVVAQGLYDRRGWMNEGWAQEQYCALLEAGKLRSQRNQSSAVLDWLQAYQLVPSRIEALMLLAEHHRKRGEYHLALLYAKDMEDLVEPPDALFSDHAAYTWRRWDEMALAHHYTGNNREALWMGRVALERGLANEKNRLEKNLVFYRSGQEPSTAPEK